MSEASDFASGSRCPGPHTRRTSGAKGLALESQTVPAPAQTDRDFTPRRTRSLTSALWRWVRKVRSQLRVTLREPPEHGGQARTSQGTHTREERPGPPASTRDAPLPWSLSRGGECPLGIRQGGPGGAGENDSPGDSFEERRAQPVFQTRRAARWRAGSGSGLVWRGRIPLPVHRHEGFEGLGSMRHHTFSLWLCKELQLTHGDSTVRCAMTLKETDHENPREQKVKSSRRPPSSHRFPHAERVVLGKRHRERPRRDSLPWRPVPGIAFFTR